MNMNAKTHTYTLFRKYEKNNLVKIGISCGGPLDSEKGIIYSPPNLPGWDSVPIVKIFKQEFDVCVEVQNDANACALGDNIGDYAALSVALNK